MSIETADQVKQRLEAKIKNKDEKIVLIEDSYVLWEACELKIFLKSPVIENLLKAGSTPDNYYRGRDYVSANAWQYDRKGYFGKFMGKSTSNYFGEYWCATNNIWRTDYQMITPYLFYTVGLGEGILITAPLFLEPDTANTVIASICKQLQDYATAIYKHYNKSVFYTLNCVVNAIEV